MTARPPDFHGPARTGGQPALAPEAERALEEARARNENESVAKGPARPLEKGGRAGPEPVRYGDWETKGRAVDF
jgi:hypothetical protein